MVARAVPYIRRLLPTFASPRGLACPACASIHSPAALQSRRDFLSCPPRKPAPHLPLFRVGQLAIPRPPCGNVSHTAELHRSELRPHQCAMASSSECLPASCGAHSPEQG